MTTLEHPDKEIKETVPRSPTELLLKKATPQIQAGKIEYPEMSKQKM